MAYSDAYKKNLKADNTQMMMSERQKFLEDTMASVVSGGTMMKKSQGNDDGGGGAKGASGGTEGKPTPFALNTNIRKPGTQVRYCGRVLRNGFCTRAGCKFTGMTKEEHEARQPCKDFASKGRCGFGINCRFSHAGDSYDSSKSCVHRGSVNNTNKGGTAGSHDDGAEESN
jgi:hypothetical protein